MRLSPRYLVVACGLLSGCTTFQIPQATDSYASLPQTPRSVDTEITHLGKHFIAPGNMRNIIDLYLEKETLDGTLTKYISLGIQHKTLCTMGASLEEREMYDSGNRIPVFGVSWFYSKKRLGPLLDIKNRCRLDKASVTALRDSCWVAYSNFSQSNVLSPSVFYQSTRVIPFQNGHARCQSRRVSDGVDFEVWFSVPQSGKWIEKRKSGTNGGEFKALTFLMRETGHRSDQMELLAFMRLLEAAATNL